MWKFSKSTITHCYVNQVGDECSKVTFSMYMTQVGGDKFVKHPNHQIKLFPDLIPKSL